MGTSCVKMKMKFFKMTVLKMELLQRPGGSLAGSQSRLCPGSTARAGHILENKGICAL